MSAVASRSIGFAAGVAESCDRLVEPTVAGAERNRQRRFIGVMLIGPFLLGAIAPALAGAAVPAQAMIAALGMTFVAAWSAVVLVARSGRLSPIAAIALAIATVLVALVIASAGGLHSPMALIAAALGFEAWWIMRDRRAIGAGAAAAVAAIAAQPFLSMLLDAPQSFSAMHWIAPLAYVGLVWPRAAAVLDEIIAREPAPSALEDVIDAVILRVDANGEVVDARGAPDRLLGVPGPMLLGEAFIDRIHIADRIAYLTALADLREGQPSRGVELRIRPAASEGGGYRPFQATLYGGGSVLVELRDNSATEALRAEIRAARDVADLTEIAKARFLAAVSHELRTPLNAIIGFSDMLAFEMAGPFANERQKDYASLIRDSGGHLLSVVNAILDVSKIESGAYSITPEPFRVAEAAASCHAMLALQAQAKSVALVNRVLPSIGEVRGDRRAVQQVLLNLLSNAVKFTPAGGTVSIDARRVGRRLVIDVTDTGIGIAADDLDRLGRPFVQVKNDYTRQYDGAGLGLSIAKGLIALHDGTMSIASAPGEGTVVTVSLPVDGPATATPTAPEAAVPALCEETHATFRKSA